jgi:hypothetical protein
MLYVIATKTKAATGLVRDVPSPMKALITVPFGNRTMADTIALILTQVSSATGMRVELLSYPFWPTDIVNFGASEAPARDVLASLFETYNRTLSYRLLFDPYPSPGYLMNIQPVLKNSAPSNNATSPQP